MDLNATSCNIKISPASQKKVNWAGDTSTKQMISSFLHQKCYVFMFLYDCCNVINISSYMRFKGFCFIAFWSSKKTNFEVGKASKDIYASR